MMLARIENLVRSVAEKQGLCVTKFDIIPGKKKGDGFLSDIYLVSASDVNGGRLDVAVKSATEDQEVVDKFHIREVFENEMKFYSQIFPTLLQYQNEKHVSETFQAVPRYYGSEFDGAVRLIALEDLKNKGFELFDKRALVDEDHVENVFIEYGKYHGVCFAYKVEHRKRFDEMCNVHDCYKVFMEGCSFKQLFNTVCKETSEALEEAGATDLVECLKKCGDAGNLLFEVASYEDEYSILTHGDCWSNNFMFKYRQNGDGKKELKELRILDWQIIRVGTPVYDLSYFLYSSASKTIFDNLDHYLDVYYKSFSKMVRDLGHQPEDLYPFHALKAEWKKYSVFGFLLRLLLQRGKLTYDDQIRELNDIKDAKDDEELARQALDANYDRKTYKERVLNLVRHMNEIGVL